MEIIFVCFITESDCSPECPSQGGEAAYPDCLCLALLVAWVSNPVLISLDGSWHRVPSCELHLNDPVLVDPASILDGFLQNQLSDVPGFSALLWSALLAKDDCSGHP